MLISAVLLGRSLSPTVDEVLAGAVVKTRGHMLYPRTFELCGIDYIAGERGDVTLISIAYMTDSASGERVSGVDYYRYNRRKDLLVLLQSEYEINIACNQLRSSKDRISLPMERLQKVVYESKI